jgi:hypothetical protein
VAEPPHLAIYAGIAMPSARLRSANLVALPGEGVALRLVGSGG